MLTGSGNAEVGDLDVSVGCDQHVLRLQVAVHDAGRLDGAQPGQQPLQDASKLRQGEPANPSPQ
ncbi:MAG: hypothetical protein ABR992_01715 [Solirubrobacteraceae bacterium]